MDQQDNNQQNANIPMKYCIGCKQELLRTSFHKNGKTTHPMCKDCRSKERASIRYSRKEGIKYCPGCKIDHSTSEFNVDQTQPDGLQSYCKSQKKLQDLARRSTYDGFIKNLFKDLRSNAKKRNIQVNITLDDIKQMYIKQNGKCAITGKIMTHQAVERENNQQHILNKWNISVDRIDSSKSYTLDNIRLVCAIINRIKFNLSECDFLLLCGAMAQLNFNKINRNVIGNIDMLYENKYPINKINSIITNLLDYDSETLTKNIKTDNPMQKWVCSFNGYANKTYLDAKHNHEKRSKKLKFDITQDHIKELYINQQGKCALSGIKMTYIGYQNNNKTTINNFNISIDRIDSTKGYIKGNIQLICAAVNRMKSDLSNNELINLSNDIYKTNFNKINTLTIDKLKSQ